MSKTLYFEGAGCVPCNDVENCRIRTAFTNRDSKNIYLEMRAAIAPNKKSRGEYRYIFCSDCHYITDNPEIDDCNESCLKCERYGTYEKYTKENILAFVNKNCNADFDEIVVLDNLAGYRVFSNGKKKGWGTSEMYNFGDCFAYDEDLTKRRIAKVAELSAHFKETFHQKYDNTSYYVEDGKLTVRIGVSEEKRVAAGYHERVFTVEV